MVDIATEGVARLLQSSQETPGYQDWTAAGQNNASNDYQGYNGGYERNNRNGDHERNDERQYRGNNHHRYRGRGYYRGKHFNSSYSKGSNVALANKSHYHNGLDRGQHKGMAYFSSQTKKVSSYVGKRPYTSTRRGKKRDLRKNHQCNYKGIRIQNENNKTKEYRQVQKKEPKNSNTKENIPQMKFDDKVETKAFYLGVRKKWAKWKNGSMHTKKTNERVIYIINDSVVSSWQYFWETYKNDRAKINYKICNSKNHAGSNHYSNENRSNQRRGTNEGTPRGARYLQVGNRSHRPDDGSSKNDDDLSKPNNDPQKPNKDDSDCDRMVAIVVYEKHTDAVNAMCIINARNLEIQGHVIKADWQNAFRPVRPENAYVRIHDTNYKYICLFTYQ